MQMRKLIVNNFVTLDGYYKGKGKMTVDKIAVVSLPISDQDRS
jgi:hypothetical protein